MGLIEEEIKEIRQLIKHLDAGKVTPEEVRMKIGLYSQTEKRERMALQALNVAAKYGRSHYGHLRNSRLLGEPGRENISIYDDTEVEDQKVKCPHRKKPITRQECLDISGEEKNFATCKDCDIGIGNKRILCGDSPDQKKGKKVSDE